MRRKKSRTCGFHFYGWCDWCKVRCHYQGDDYPPKELSDTGACPWASRFAEKNFCPTPVQALHLSVQRQDRPAAVQLRSVLEHRICPECQKPVRPLRDRESYEKYQLMGECQDCIDAGERAEHDDDELVEEDFE